MTEATSTGSTAEAPATPKRPRGRSKTADTGASSSGSMRTPLGPEFDAVVASAAEAAKTCVDDLATLYKGSYDKARKGQYTADAMVSAMADMWTLYVRNGALIGGLAIQAAAAASATRDPAAGAPATPDAQASNRSAKGDGTT